jgi:hypothetical protein
MCPQPRDTSPQPDGAGGTQPDIVPVGPHSVDPRVAAHLRNRSVQLEIADLGVRIEIGEEISDDLRRRRIEANAITNIVITTMRRR